MACQTFILLEQILFSSTFTDFHYQTMKQSTTSSSSTYTSRAMIVIFHVHAVRDAGAYSYRGIEKEVEEEMTALNTCTLRKGEHILTYFSTSFSPLLSRVFVYITVLNFRFSHLNTFVTATSV